MGYLRHGQIEEIENERRVIENTLQSREVQERANLLGHLRRIDRQLSEQAPPDLTPAERDTKARECQQIEERLVPMMPSDEEMRKNPPGVVGRHMRFEKAAKARSEQFPEGMLARWKDNQLALHKGSDDPDVANFERLRPRVNPVTSLLGAQIPGQLYVGTNPSPAYLEGYDRTFGTPEQRETKAGKSASPVEVMACGKEVKSKGKHFHIAKCSVCKAAKG